MIGDTRRVTLIIGEADNRDGGRSQVLKAEAEAKGDDEWERSMRRSMK